MSMKLRVILDILEKFYSISDLFPRCIVRKARYMELLTLDADFYLCHRFSLFIIRNFGDIASRPNKNYISLPAEFSEVFWHFLAA